MEDKKNQIGDLVSSESITRMRLRCKLKYLKLTNKENPTEELQKEIKSIRKTIFDLETNYNDVVNDQSLKAQLDLAKNISALSYLKAWKKLTEQEKKDKIEEYVNRKLFFQNDKDRHKMLKFLIKKYGKKFSNDVLYSSSLGEIISIKGMILNPQTYSSEIQ